MESIGKIYQLYDPNSSDCNNELHYFKRILQEAGFRWAKKGRCSKVYLYSGRDILDFNNFNLVGYIDEGKLHTENSRLEKFLDELDIDL